MGTAISSGKKICINARMMSSEDHSKSIKYHDEGSKKTRVKKVFQSEVLAPRGKWYSHLERKEYPHRDLTMYILAVNGKHVHLFAFSLGNNFCVSVHRFTCWSEQFNNKATGCFSSRELQRRSYWSKFND